MGSRQRLALLPGDRNGFCDGDRAADVPGRAGEGCDGDRQDGENQCLAGHDLLSFRETADRAAISTKASNERSEEHTSELQSLMRISYAVFCLKKKKNTYQNKNN